MPAIRCQVVTTVEGEDTLVGHLFVHVVPAPQSIIMFEKRIKGYQSWTVVNAIHRVGTGEKGYVPEQDIYITAVPTFKRTEE